MTDNRAALANMVDKDHLISQKYIEQNLRARRAGAHPDVLEFERRIRKQMGALGVPVFAHCVIRSLEQQRIEYDQGDSKVLFGPHNVGCAVDIIHATRAWDLEKAQWEIIGHVGQEIVQRAGLALVSLAWGGEWGFYDPAHWEVADWRNLKLGESYPWLT